MQATTGVSMLPEGWALEEALDLSIQAVLLEEVLS